LQRPDPEPLAPERSFAGLRQAGCTFKTRFEGAPRAANIVPVRFSKQPLADAEPNWEADA